MEFNTHLKLLDRAVRIDKDKILKQLLKSGNMLIMPDAYDSISAKIIQYAGFSAIQCSGYSYSISKGYKIEADVDLGIARVSLPAVMIFNSVGYILKNLIDIKYTGNFNQMIQDNCLLSDENLLKNIYLTSEFWLSRYSYNYKPNHIVRIISLFSILCANSFIFSCIFLAVAINSLSPLPVGSSERQSSPCLHGKNR